VSDIDTVLVDSLKALDPKRPIREADIYHQSRFKAQTPQFRQTSTFATAECLGLISNSHVAHWI
jgi:hypothetical protein